MNADTSVGASGSGLWQKIHDRWRARRTERETKTHQIATWRDAGRRGDGGHELGAEGICQGRQQEHGREATQRRSQDALRALSACEGSQRRSLHVLDDQARGARVQETERAIARLLVTGGDQGKGSRPRSSRDSGVHGPVASAVTERQHRGSGKRGGTGKPQANVGRYGTGGSFQFGTSLQAGQSARPSSEPSRTRHQRGTTPRTHSRGTRTNRSESSSRSSSKRSFGTGTVSSDRTELKESEFCCSITSRLTYQTPSATG